MLNNPFRYLRRKWTMQFVVRADCIVHFRRKYLKGLLSIPCDGRGARRRPQGQSFSVSPLGTNTTGDAVFDGTLRKALTISLQQSPFLNVFPEVKVRQTLQLMGRSPDQRMTNELAREIESRPSNRRTP